MVRKRMTNCLGCGKSSKTASGYCGECFHANVNNIKTEYNRKRWTNGQAKISCWKSRGACCSEEDVQTFNEQKVCQICGIQETPLHFDHCHLTGLYRGALCKQCNVSLGKLGDNLDVVLDRVQKYKNQFDERVSLEQPVPFGTSRAQPAPTV
jgi:hypothetical protein